MSITDKLRALHAKYHDMPGNLYGRDECGYTRCDFWDAAIFLDAEQDETTDPCVAERIEQIRRTAIRVKPIDVGVFKAMLPTSVADLMAIAPVDLAWLCALAAPSVSPGGSEGQPEGSERCHHCGYVSPEACEALIQEALLEAARAARKSPSDLDLGDAPARGEWWIRQVVGAWLEARITNRNTPRSASRRPRGGG